MRSQLRLRVLLPVAVLALLGLGVGAFAFGGSPPDQTPIASADVLRAHRKQTLHDTKKHQAKHHKKAQAKAKPKASKPKTAAKPKPKPKAQAGNPLSQALAAHRVVVVFLYTPNS